MDETNETENELMENDQDSSTLTENQLKIEQSLNKELSFKNDKLLAQNVLLCKAIKQEKIANEKLNQEKKKLELQVLNLFSKMKTMITSQKQYTMQDKKTQKSIISEMKHLKETFSTNNEKISKLSLSNQQLTNIIEEKTCEIEDLNQKIESLQNDLTKNEKQLTKNEKYINKLQNDLQACMETNVVFKSENDELKANIKQYNENEIEMSKEIEYWRNEYNIHANQCKKLESSNIVLNAKYVFFIWKCLHLKRKFLRQEWKHFISFTILNNEMNQIVDICYYINQKRKVNKEREKQRQNESNNNENSENNETKEENQCQNSMKKENKNSMSKQLLNQDLQNISDILTFYQINPKQQLQFAAKLLPVIEQYRKQLTNQINAKMMMPSCAPNNHPI